jgi:hypothetical protein
MGKFGAIRTVRQDQPASQAEENEATPVPSPHPSVCVDDQPGSGAIPTLSQRPSFFGKPQRKRPTGHLRTQA